MINNYGTVLNEKLRPSLTNQTVAHSAYFKVYNETNVESLTEHSPLAA